ncbi:MAG TPA: TatD family hydrolase [Planctomycetota bacterium]|nr:TatD family hydrolase [Planctomycetota bacterium]
MMPPLVDTHCHLTNARFAADVDAVIARAREAGLWRCQLIGTGLADARAARALVDRHPDLLACAAGLDPFSCHEAGDGFDAALAELETLLAAGGFQGLGEIGLEYHHQLLPHDVQIAQLERQLALARRLGLPAIIHVRDAHDDMLATLARHEGTRGVIHSYIGDAPTARRYLDLGWHLSFNGTLTFKANAFLREAAAIVPADRLLIETDSPYLAPMPLRGQRCEPGFVVHTLHLLAEVRGERPEDVAAWTTRNACALFRLPLPW